MKKMIIISIAVIVLAGGLIVMLIFSRSGDSSSAPGGEATVGITLKFSDIENDVKNGAKLYDVRTPEEFAAGHFTSAENWPLQDLMDGKLPDVSKDTKIYVHCRSGVRSAQAAQILGDNGFTNVVDLHGLADIEQIGGELTQ
jgi:rhodanese-related sulfurtransferase